MPKAMGEQRISVALCTHNGAEYVDRQIASILDQSRPVDEIVLSDDASTDDTVAIVRRAVTEYSAHSGVAIELRVLANPVALGVVANFEQAVLATTGSLIALCDQDDVWHRDKIETALRLFDEQPAVELVFSDARLVDGAGAPLTHSLFQALSMTRGERRLLLGGAAFEALLGRNLVTGATVVFRRSLLDRAAPFAPDWVHDEWLAALAAAAGGVRMLDAALIDYRQHGGNQIGAGRPSLSEKVGRVAEARTARNARLLARAGELVDRLRALGGLTSASVLAEAEGKLAHERLRSALPASRVRRVPPITRELLGGRYRRYGRGIIDAGRDLLQPAD
jgi:glycosyltransferase involved in cell wall biosynthesis